MFKFPEHAPFGAEEKSVLEGVVGGLSAEQRHWLSGFLAAAPGAFPVAVGAAGGARSLTVLYGTESGNCEVLAAKTVAAAKKRGFKARVSNMADGSPEDLKKAEDLLVIVSTWGEGDPPETAEAFHRALMSGGPRLEGMRYAVCALGDTSYEDFCEIGKQVDRRLGELGATRLVDRQDCDVDFEEPHAAWLEKVFKALGENSGGGGVVAVAPSAPAVEYGKKMPFPSEVLEKVLLNGKGTRKETWHLELSLEGSGMSYEAGDALAVVPFNAPDVVESILKATGYAGAAEVTLKGGEKMRLAEALEQQLDITALSRAVAKKLAELTRSESLLALLDEGRKELFRDYVEGRQIVDLLEDYPVGTLAVDDFVSALRPLPPRLYSIASSPKAHPGEVHLTVAAVRYGTHGKSRKGVASTCLADLVAVGDRVGVFVQPNKRFRLPEDNAVPVIMVGPGTGVAPFRAFVEERGARGSGGDTWLFFGDQHFSYDFLYQLEWQEHLQSGALTRLDVAFSRDQPEKIYVQDRMRERAAELHAWLEAGAYFYVCGDANRMAGDVHEALIEIVVSEGGRSREEAEAFVEKLKKDGRYQRDVY